MADAPQDTAPAADFPETARPFYAKIDRESKSADNGVRVTDAFDFFVRNQEVLSGGQRINNPDELEERIRAKGVDTYLATFRQVGVPPHGGVGFGLDRIVAWLLCLELDHKLGGRTRQKRSYLKTSPVSDQS